MGYWKSKPNRYNEHNFIEIPEGDYRVKIFGVSRETFKTGTFGITRIFQNAK